LFEFYKNFAWILPNILLEQVLFEHKRMAQVLSWNAYGIIKSQITNIRYVQHTRCVHKFQAQGKTREWEKTDGKEEGRIRNRNIGIQ
jgi:hypothetical protein